jgi:hypothetical protein
MKKPPGFRPMVRHPVLGTSIKTCWFRGWCDAGETNRLRIQAEKNGMGFHAIKRNHQNEEEYFDVHIYSK